MPAKQRKFRDFFERSCYFAGSLCGLQESPQASTSSRIDLKESEQITEFPRFREPIDQGAEPRKRKRGNPGNTFSTFLPTSFARGSDPSSIYVLYRRGKRDRDVEIVIMERVDETV